MGLSVRSLMYPEFISRTYRIPTAMKTKLSVQRAHSNRTYYAFQERGLSVNTFKFLTMEAFVHFESKMDNSSMFFFRDYICHIYVQHPHPAQAWTFFSSTMTAVSRYKTLTTLQIDVTAFETGLKFSLDGASNSNASTFFDFFDDAVDEYIRRVELYWSTVKKV